MGISSPTNISMASSKEEYGNTLDEDDARELLDKVEAFLDSFSFQMKDTKTIKGLSKELATADLASSPPATLQRILLKLSLLVAVPRACTTAEEDLTDQDRMERDDFLVKSPPLLSLALQILQLPRYPSSQDREDIENRAQLFMVFGKFMGEEEDSQAFTSITSARLATEICSHLLLPSSHRLPILTHILSTLFPPLFKPHPKLNPQTGRVLPRPKGGERHMTDWFDESDEVTGWRGQKGLHTVVRVAVEGLKKEEVEQVWHLLLPPVLAYLDDYDSTNKVLGTNLLDKLLDRVDQSLLVRTGVGQVFQQSLKSAFTSLSDPTTPTLLSLSLPLSLKLLSILHPPLPSPLPPSPPKSYNTQSESRFNALSELFVDAVITPWEFKSGQVEIEVTILKYLLGPSSKESLGLLETMGRPLTIRYLGILLPHLSNLLNSIATASIKSLELKILATRCLGLMVGELGDGKLLRRWKALLVGEVGKCWIDLGEREKEGALKGMEKDLQTLREALKEVVRVLSRAEEGEVNYVEKLRELDPAFRTLVAVS